LGEQRRAATRKGVDGGTLVEVEVKDQREPVLLLPLQLELNSRVVHIERLPIALKVPPLPPLLLLWSPLFLSLLHIGE
jgi:hypothetical protein